MGSDPPDLGKGLFGYRKSVVNQIIADRDIMLRQAEGRVRAAESKVADLEGELSSMRERNGRMDEQLERLRAQLDMLASRTDDLDAAPFRTESIVNAIQELSRSQSSESPSVAEERTSSTDEYSYDVSAYEGPSYEIPAYYEQQPSEPRTSESEIHEAGTQEPESSEPPVYEPQAYEPQAYEPPVAGADVAEADDDVLAALSYEPSEEEFSVPSAVAEEQPEEPSFFDAAFGEEQPSESGAESGPAAFDANAVEVVPHPDDALDAGSMGELERSEGGPEAYDPSIDPSVEAEVESWSFEGPQAEVAEAEQEPEPAAASFHPGVDVQAEAPEADQGFASEPEATLQEEGNEDMSYQADSPNVFDRAPFVSASAGDEPAPQVSSPAEVSARETAFAVPPFSSTTAYQEAPVAPRQPDDITSKFLNEELAGILHAAEESSARIVERARATTQQQIAQSNRLWREVQAEVARFASWREEVEPVIRTVQGKVDGVRSQIEQVPERIRQALAPMADAISTIDADLAELAAACSPPLLLTPSGLEHVRQENGEWSFKAEDEMPPPAGETQAETEDGSFGANAG
jgi:peptidoglycan hydrolase CwlO-like protein